MLAIEEIFLFLETKTVEMLPVSLASVNRILITRFVPIPPPHHLPPAALPIHSSEMAKLPIGSQQNLAHQFEAEPKPLYLWPVFLS